MVDSGFFDVVGIIHSIENGVCKMQVVDEYGFADGISNFLIDDVTKLVFSSDDEKRIQKLIDKGTLFPSPKETK